MKKISKLSTLDGVLFNKDKTKLIRYLEGKEETTSIIPLGVTEIVIDAFFGCFDLAKVILDTIGFSYDESLIFIYTDVVYIKEDLSVEGFSTLETYFTKQKTSDKTGYDKYVRNVVNQ